MSEREDTRSLQMLAAQVLHTSGQAAAMETIIIWLVGETVRQAPDPAARVNALLSILQPLGEEGTRLACSSPPSALAIEAQRDFMNRVMQAARDAAKLL